MMQSRLFIKAECDFFCVRMIKSQRSSNYDKMIEIIFRRILAKSVRIIFLQFKADTRCPKQQMPQHHSKLAKI